MEFQALAKMNENTAVCNAQKYTTGQEVKSKCISVSVINATCVNSNNERNNGSRDMSSINNTSITKGRQSSPNKRRSHKAVTERRKYKHNGRNSLVTNCNSPLSSNSKNVATNSGNTSFTKSPKNRIPCLYRARFQNNNRRHKIRRKYQNVAQNQNDRSPSSAVSDQQYLSDEDIKNDAFIDQHPADTSSKDETLVSVDESKSHPVKCSATDLLQNLVAEIGVISPNSSASKAKKSSSTTSLNQITSTDGTALAMGTALSLPSIATATNCNLDPAQLLNALSNRNIKEECKRYKEFSSLFHLEPEDVKPKINRNGNGQNCSGTPVNTNSSGYNGNSPITKSTDAKFGRLKVPSKRKTFNPSQGTVPNLQYQNAISLICESMSPHQNQSRLRATQPIFDPTMLQKHILNQQILQYQILQQKLILYNQQLSLDQKLNLSKSRQTDNSQTSSGQRKFENRQHFGFNKMPLQSTFQPFNNQPGSSRSNFRWNSAIKRGNFNSPNKSCNNKNGDKNLNNKENINNAANERQTPSPSQREAATYKLYSNNREMDSPQPMAVEIGDVKKKTVTFEDVKKDADNSGEKQSKNLPTESNKIKNPYKKCRSGNEITADTNNNKTIRNIRNNLKILANDAPDPNYQRSEDTKTENESEEGQGKNEKPALISNNKVGSSLSRSKNIKNLRTLKYVGTAQQVHNFWPKNNDLITCEKSRYTKHYNDDNNNTNNFNQNHQNGHFNNKAGQSQSNVQNDHNFNEVYSSYHNENKNEGPHSYNVSPTGSMDDLQAENTSAGKNGCFPHSHGKNNLYFYRGFHYARTGSSRQLAYLTPADRYLDKYQLFETVLPSESFRNDPLSESIWEVFQEQQQAKLTFDRKMHVWRDLYLLIKESYPYYGLYLVGSTLSGFGTDTSDVDLCVIHRNLKSRDLRGDALTHLGNIHKLLIESNLTQSNLIRAKVPILRFFHDKTNIEVDINFNNCVSIKNSHLLFCYSKLEWRVRPLVLIAKVWAKQSKINNAKERTISSYSLTLMVIHFLQTGVSPPVIPRLHERYPAIFKIMKSHDDLGYVDPIAFIGGYSSNNNQTLGELFIAFLKYYANFDYDTYAISVRTENMTVEECMTRDHPLNNPNEWQQLCVEEPFNLTNAARSCYDKVTFDYIRHVFYASWQNLEKYNDINVVLPRYEHRQTSRWPEEAI